MALRDGLARTIAYFRELDLSRYHRPTDYHYTGAGVTMGGH